MEQIAIISCIVIFILLCCYWLVKFILSIRKEFKLEEENRLLEIDIKNFRKRFRTLLLTSGVDDTAWGYYRMNIIEECIKTALDIHPLWTAEEENERYNSFIKLLDSKYEKYKNELISKILPEIDYNIDNCLKLKKSFPNFFVAESVGGIKDTLYCFSYNMEFDSSNSTFSGIVFTNVNSEGCIKYFNPKDWGIRKMTDNEFNKIFLPNILDKCKFNDARGLKDYSNYLKKEFKNFKENYEQ
jgi:hypothetical protein